MAIWMLKLCLIIKEPSVEPAASLVVLLSPMVSLKVFLIAVKYDAFPKCLFLSFGSGLPWDSWFNNSTAISFPKVTASQCLVEKLIQLHLTYVRLGLPSQGPVSPSSGQGRCSPSSDQFSNFLWIPGSAVCEFCQLHWQLCKTK